jgi:hypothetical protein
MSETVQSNLLHRLNNTPLRDLLRGRITGRLGYESTILRANLSPQIRDLIRRVVRGTRLWRLEKVDVASELIAHFLDGREAGATFEQMIESFGDEKAAARLIRRAKIRNRPLLWHFSHAGFHFPDPDLQHSDDPVRDEPAVAERGLSRCHQQAGESNHTRPARLANLSAGTDGGAATLAGRQQPGEMGLHL